MRILRHVYQNTHKKSIIHNLKILSDEKLRTNIGFNLKPPRALYLVLWRRDTHSPEGQKWPMNQLEILSNTTNRAEIFTRSVSLRDHSSLKISARKDHPKWEIVSEGALKHLLFYNSFFYSVVSDKQMVHLSLPVTFHVSSFCETRSKRSVQVYKGKNLHPPSSPQMWPISLAMTHHRRDRHDWQTITDRDRH